MVKKIILVSLCVLNLFAITLFSTQSAEKSKKLSENITYKIVTVNPQNKNTEPPTATTMFRVNEFIRSFAHFLLFLSLGMLVYLTLKSFDLRHQFWYAFSFCVLYALFDECYQELLNQGRAFQFEDLLKDWLGSFVGILGTKIIAMIFVK